MASPSFLSTTSLFSPNPKPKNHGPKSRVRPRPKTEPKPPPISISVNPAHVDPAHVQALMHSCGHSCLRLSPPAASAAGQPVDLGKLTVALAHSFLVVSVFVGTRFLDSGERDGVSRLPVPAREPGRRLVGFGRAVSDGGLTASIHDVVVHPSLQRRGIGRKIVERIVRILTNRGIYDISVLCTEKERPFFEACGFGEDSLGSTTMMYTRTTPSEF